MSIHATIRSNRLRLGMTEQQLADQVGVTRAAVQQWEREGGTAPRRSKQADVANVLGISLAELLGAAEAATGAMLSAPEPSNVAPAPAAPAEMSLGQTLARLGEELGRASPQTRAAVADLLSRYAQNPAQGQSLAQAIEMLVRSDTNKEADA